MQTTTRGYAQMIAINADLATVWAACTEAESLKLWYALEASVEPRRGGRWRLRRRDGALAEAVIDVYDSGRRLRLIYVTPPVSLDAGKSAPIVDDILFERRAGECVVRILGSGVPTEPLWDKNYVLLRQGWAFYLRELKRVLESGKETAA